MIIETFVKIAGQGRKLDWKETNFFITLQDCWWVNAVSIFNF